MKKSKNYLFPILAIAAVLALPLLLLQTERARADYITGSPGVLPVAGTAVSTPTTSVSTNGYTILGSDQFIELPYTNITVTLPGISPGFVNGKTYSFKNLSPNGTNYIAYPGSGKTIDGQVTWMLTNHYASLVVRCDGSKWYILASSGAAYVP